MSQSLATAHITVVCSDDVSRRFYIDCGEKPYDEAIRGWVIYHGERVRGTVIALLHGRTFIADRINSISIPRKSGWVIHANCAASSFCSRTRRCVGGCKK